MSELLAELRNGLTGYQVDREIGRGGMATVFLARDLRHERAVAIKVVHAEVGTALGKERFLREIGLAARLQHPHIVPLYDSGEAAGHLYFVMPFIEGETLRERLEREKQLSYDEIARITAQVSSALEHAHEHGVVHRDVKPENIMLSGGVAVLADFGIARLLSGPEQGGLTRTGTMVGTPLYMSPEQATGATEVDARSDQYGLACVVYEMLVGQPPFTGPTPQAVLARHTLDTPSAPSIVRDTIPAAMEAALMRALAKLPADRFATVAKFSEALTAPSTRTAASLRTRSTQQATLVRRLWTNRFVMGSALLLALAVGLWWARDLWRGRGAAADEPLLDPAHIAVTYFEDRTPTGELRYLANGFTETLIEALSALPQLHVISANGVAQFRDGGSGLDSIARILKVGTLVRGTVDRDGERLRVAVSLVNGIDARVLSSKTLALDPSNALALQDSISREISVFLRERLGRELQALQGRAGVRDPAAWELVLRARTTAAGIAPLLDAADTASAARELLRADSLLAQAAARDPGWITPVLERGWLAYRSEQLAPYEKAHAANWLATGLDFAERALRLSPGHPDALRLRGTLRYWRFILNLDPSPLTSEQLLASAEADLRAAAVPANPNQASAWSLLSHLLMRKSETAAGKLAALRAYEADPFLAEAATVLYRLFTASVDLEDSVEADRWCREGVHRFGQNPWFLECQILVNALPGHRPDVAKMWELRDQLVAAYSPAEREFRRRRTALFVAMGITRAGLPDSARAVALRARADATIDPTRDLVYIEILLRNILGDRAEALELIGTYLATNPQDRTNLANDNTWWFRGIREDPRFRALVSAGK